jgi:hypothetical protein
MVARLTPSARAMEETLSSGRASRSRACRICSAVMAGRMGQRYKPCDRPCGRSFAHRIWTLVVRLLASRISEVEYADDHIS